MSGIAKLKQLCKNIADSIRYAKISTDLIKSVELCRLDR